MRNFTIVFLLLLLGCSSESSNTEPGNSNPASNTEVQADMTLEEQLDKLATLGITLNDGVTIDDLIYSFDRESFESEPFDLILFALGTEVEREPWGRAVCSRAWNFDTECISQTGDYVEIVERLCVVAGQPGLISNATDLVDLDTGSAWLKYTIDGKERDRSIDVNDDWADTLTLSYVMSDIERDGKRFYAKDNGQAMILYYLNAESAAEINRLSNDALAPVIPD